MGREELWNSRYQETDYAFGTEPNEFLKENVDQLPSGKILCMAEGEGRNAVFLAKRGYEVVAVDYAEVGLKKAEQLASQHGVKITTVLADLNEFSFASEEYTGVISVFCHLDPAIRERVHSKVVESLQPEGVLLLEGYTPEQLNYGTGGPPREEMMFTPEMMKSDFARLKVLLCRQREREVVEGRLHTGLASVVQFIAQKPLIV